ncbi:cyanophycinase [Undibacterium sp. RuTC16W]|uniref:cyanophycinase n=1 Tax=Undibacterium sp. RuTC16W TaxID=3413048 RepID=UPI003BF2DE65
MKKIFAQQWMYLIQMGLCVSVLTYFMEAVQAAEPVLPENAGTLVIIGGALRTDNAPVWEKIVQLAGGKNTKIAVIPAGAASPENTGASLAAKLNLYGADAFVVPLSVKWKNQDVRRVANDAQIASQIRAAGGVYFSGGDQSKITQALFNADGSQTEVLKAIWNVYQKGGVIAGSSAGAAIMSSTMFYQPKSVLSVLQQGVTEGKEIGPGLGFIGDKIFIDQHLIIRGRFARMIPAMQAKNYQIGLGIDENTAMVIRNRNDIEIIGYKGALLIDLTDMTSDNKMKAFNASNVKISYLDSGDRYRIDSKTLIPSKDKLHGAIDPLNPYNAAKKFYPDILANTVVVDLMQDLIDSKHEQARGIAFGDPDGENADQGFEFVFSKVPESKGYYSGSTGVEAYTVMNIRLDIRPLVMQLPMYRYK